MDRLRLRALLILTGITVPASYLMQVFLGLLYERDLPAVFGKLRVFNIVVVVLEIGANILLWRALAPLSRASAKVTAGKVLGEDERRLARGSGEKAVRAILITVIFAYVIGPVAGIVANSATGIASYEAADVFFIFLINVAIGVMAGTHCVLLIENLIRHPLETLEVRVVDARDRYVSLSGRILLASLSSLIFAVSFFAAAGHGYLQAVREGFAIPVLRYLIEMGILAFFVLVWGSWLSYTIAAGLGSRLKAMTGRIEDIVEGGGDLRLRTSIVRNDDIGCLASAFNRFLDLLESLVGKTKAMVADVSTSADSLALSAGQARESVEALEGSLSSVRSSAEAQDQAVARTRERIGHIAASIDAVADRVGTQAGFVEQSSAAVSEMAANITGVSRTAEKADTVAAELKQLSEEGGDALRASVAAIRELEESSRSVGAIVSSISKIAAQTNLLAMNAAIEAAHAGEAGAGFAVVADEVRGLAESASRSAREISTLIADMTGRIGKGVGLADRAGTAFERIRVGVDGTSELVRTIAAAMGEQKVGADEILGSVNSLIEATESIRDLADGQRAKSREMREAMDSIVAASENILSSIHEEEGSTSVLARVVGVVREEAERNRAATVSLSESVGRFRTEGR